MIHIIITHNPYLIKTNIFIDGDEVKGGPLYELVVDKRLQMWLDKIFPQLSEFCNSDEYDVSFRGTIADFNDIELVAKAYSSESGITIKLTHLAGGDADPAKKITALKELFERAKAGPIEEFHDEEIDREFKKALNEDFEVSVIATMSAGKSTLINAILGEDLLPAKNEACTATLTYITDYDEMNYFSGRAFDEKDAPQSDWVRITSDLLHEWNKEHIARVEIEGNIPMIKSENVRLVLADTPGPNNSRNDSHHRCTMGMIKNEQKPMILYVLNASQLSTNDDHHLLSVVAKEMSRGGKQSRDRFIFAVNKIDGFDPEKESISKALENVRNYLEEHEIHNPNIYPVSALVSKLIRMKRKGYVLSRQEKRDLPGKVELFVEDEAMHLLQYMPVSNTVKKKMLKSIAEAQRTEDKEELALLYSGVPVIEECIQEYLTKYALPAKLHDAKASFNIILDRRETLSRIDEELRKSASEREILHEQMLKIKSRIKQGKEAKNFEARLKKMEWKQSNEYISCIKPLYDSIAKKINKLLSSLGSEDMSPSSAQCLLSGIEQEANSVAIDLQIELDKAVKRETIVVMEQIKNEYKEYVQNLLSDTENTSLALKEFKMAASMLPSSVSMVSKYSEKRRVVVGSHHVSNSTWWKPWTWGSTREVKEYGVKEIVNINELTAELADVLRRNFFVNFTEAEKFASETVLTIRDEFLANITELDSSLQQMVDTMADKTASADALEKAIKENNEKRMWLDTFQRQLDEVLSI